MTTKGSPPIFRNFPNSAGIFCYNNIISSQSALNVLYFNILMDEIGDDNFSLYLSGNSSMMTISYNTAIFLWYYLLAKYYNVTLEGIELARYRVFGTQKITTYILEDIPIIQAEYDKVKTREELLEFRRIYIDEPFSRIYENNKPTVAMMSDTLRKIDEDLWEYVENRLNSTEDIEQDLRFLMDEIYASLILSFNNYKEKPLIFQYIPLLLQFITQITTNIKVTDSYKIVYNLKPFHTEILDLVNNKIEIQDKFNAILFNDYFDTMFLLIVGDLLHMSDQQIFTYIPKEDQSALSLNSLYHLNSIDRKSVV